jgi:diaminopimelate epimerase
MKLEFTKMHGLGNDYIYVYCPEKEPSNPNEISILISKRHFSVGSDGLVLICKSSVADAKMRMFNADGSEGGMCGNSVRCVGKYLYDKNIIKKDKISIETLSGIKYLTLYSGDDGLVDTVSVDMGKADFSPCAVPTVFDDEAIDKPVVVGGKEYNVTALSTGSAHCVVFENDVFNMDISEIGPLFENHEIFPERVNTEFIQCVDSRNINMRVWEKGSGETLACGTGACAVVAASARLGKCEFGVPIIVHLRGGELEIVCYSDYSLVMKGKAETVYDGIISIPSELW